ncbi:MAG: PKD domain-containing protein [Fibrobacterota bacterium]|nr:PKD domain-containing protein [Fibrobacterota bacterium]
MAIGLAASSLLTAVFCAGLLGASPIIPTPDPGFSGPPAINQVVPFSSSLPIPGPVTIPGIKRYQRVDIDSRRLTGIAERLHQGPLALDLGAGLRWDLELERISVRAPGYRVRLLGSQGIKDATPSPEQSFRGRIRGNPSSRVRLSLADGKVTGFIDAGDGDRTFIEPLEMFNRGLPAGSHMVYRQSDMVMPSGAGCGWRPTGDLTELLPPGADPLSTSIRAPFTESLPGLTKSAESLSTFGPEPCGLVEIAVAVEYSMVKGYGSAAAAEKRINDIFAMVSGLYDDPRINILIKISEIVIETEAKLTWGAMNINTFLTNLTPWARSAQGFKNPYDVANLWYYDPLVTTGTTGLANVSTVCNRTSGGNVVRDFTRTASFLMINQAHELGHNFGANHVNNSKALLNPLILGDNVSWDDTTIAAILKHKRSRTCLSSCNQGPTADFLVKGPSPCSDIQQFTDVSKGEPTSWLWKFGDGQASTVRNPSHKYGQAGTYMARLTATNAVGSDTVVNADIKVKPYAVPAVMGANSCTPARLILNATGSGVLKWYEQAAGGDKLGEGAAFQTPLLSASKIYYVENGDPDFPIVKVGPAANTIGAGQYFLANSDRRLYFDVNRRGTLKSVKVYAAGAGPRTLEILDQGDVRVAARTVQVPAGESRVALNIDLEPGHDYAIKYSGKPDSLNLFRNSAGAVFPYQSKDSLFTITHSDATPSDSTTQSGYFYFFYDWEIQERECGSVRAPVAAEISCVPIASATGTGVATLRSLGAGRFRLDGSLGSAQWLEYRLLNLDGRNARTASKWLQTGPFNLDFDLAGLPANLYLLEVRQGGVRIMQKLIGQ